MANTEHGSLPAPHCARRSPMMEKQCWEVKWEHRDDCVSALMVKSTRISSTTLLFIGPSLSDPQESPTSHCNMGSSANFNRPDRASQLSPYPRITPFSSRATPDVQFSDVTFCTSTSTRHWGCRRFFCPESRGCSWPRPRQAV